MQRYYFNGLIFEDFRETQLDNETHNEINGYPVKHNPFYNIDDLTYTAKENSSVRYHAGYWAIKYKNNTRWLPALNPKVKTTETNDSAGPFTDKQTCLSEIGIIHKREESDI